MSDILKKAISLGLGITAVSREKIQQFVDELVDKGEMAQTESKDVVNRLIARGEEQKEEIKRMVQDQVKKILADLNVATKQDLLDLEQKLNSANAAVIPPVDPPIL
jgi:polyhydroxyalkanoate synthesis regulator phasin